jgi:mono/diheme cytochrome c family protein
MFRMGIWLVGAGLIFAAAGCHSTGTPVLTHPTYPAPTVVTAPAVPIGTVVGEAAAGAQLWNAKQCAACHGPNAAGGMGGALLGTALPFDQFLSKIRNAIPPKPAMNAADLSDADAYSIYLWLHTLSPELSKTPVVSPTPLPAGEILGIQVWSEKGCGECHGAFAQGSAVAPRLAGEAYPFERQRALMRASADKNPAHSAQNIPDDLLQRLLDWLRRGANPTDGC